MSMDTEAVSADGGAGSGITGGGHRSMSSRSINNRAAAAGQDSKPQLIAEMLRVITTPAKLVDPSVACLISWAGDDRGDYYVPRTVHIGPFHWQKPSDGNNRREEKMAAVNSLLLAEISERESWKEELGNHLKAMERLVRGARQCYGSAFSSMTRDVFAEMLLLDGCFLYSRFVPVPRSAELLCDIMEDRDMMFLLENQIPFSVLEEIHGRLTETGRILDNSNPVLDQVAKRVREVLQRSNYIARTVDHVPGDPPPCHILHLLYMYFSPTPAPASASPSTSATATSASPSASATATPAAPAAVTTSSSATSSSSASATATPAAPAAIATSASAPATASALAAVTTSASASSSATATSAAPAAVATSASAPATASASATAAAPAAVTTSSSSSSSASASASATATPAAPAAVATSASAPATASASASPAAQSGSIGCCCIDVNLQLLGCVTSQDNTEQPPQRQNNNTGGDRNPVPQIRWRTATQYYASKVGFVKRELDDGGRNNGARSILDVDLVKDKLHIPTLTIDTNTFRMLRNMVALEQRALRQPPPSRTSHVTAYCLFLSQLAGTEEDVALLVSKGIIVHLLRGDDDVAQELAGLCNGVVIDAYDPDTNYLRPKYEALEELFHSRCRRSMAWLCHDRCGNYCKLAAALAASVVPVATVLQLVFAGLSYGRGK